MSFGGSFSWAFQLALEGERRGGKEGEGEERSGTRGGEGKEGEGEERSGRRGGGGEEGEEGEERRGRGRRGVGGEEGEERRGRRGGGVDHYQCTNHNNSHPTPRPPNASSSAAAPHTPTRRPQPLASHAVRPAAHARTLTRSRSRRDCVSLAL